MKLNLVVLTSGKTEGKIISVNLPQFLIGRDPHCHLRPASPVISNRHCALISRADRAYVRDFESTNGTFVNEVRVRGQAELKEGDQLRIGPLVFKVLVDAEAPVDRTTAPADTGPHSPEETAAAALLLDGPEDVSLGTLTDGEGVPTGSTVMELPAVPPPAEGADASGEKKTEEAKSTANKAGVGDTSSAASTLLQKYLRRKKN